jgi:hypothetical protein
MFVNANLVQRSRVWCFCFVLLDLGMVRLDHGFWFRVELSQGTTSILRRPFHCLGTGDPDNIIVMFVTIRSSNVLFKVI